MASDCQVCGKPAAGEGFVEGTKVPLCEKCSNYASSFAYYKEYQDFVNERKFAQKPSYSTPSFGTPKPRPVKGGVLVEDFGKRIMQGRNKINISRKDLANKIFIQERELDGFEQQKFKPTDVIIKKLEIALGIVLTEVEED